jgi:hypothetical protein
VSHFTFHTPFCLISPVTIYSHLLFIFCLFYICQPGCGFVTGVMASEDGVDVATSVSLVEWFINFYEEAQECRVKPQECILKAGELLFVPRNWWHMALNLEVTPYFHLSIPGGYHIAYGSLHLFRA